MRRWRTNHVCYSLGLKALPFLLAIDQYALNVASLIFEQLSTTLFASTKPYTCSQRTHML